MKQENELLNVNLVADFFIWKSKKEDKAITNKKLQKLLYYAQAWFLVLKDKPLFKEEIEAWVHGPTVRTVYFSYKTFGFGPINKQVDNDIETKLQDNAKFLNEIWRVYGKFDADYLETLTHCEKPWQKAREGLEDHAISDNVISHKEMKNYYGKKLREVRAKKNV